MSNKPKFALALSSGGPRGFAYIGAIEEILSRGYEISSIAGSSAGSLVGGIYAAGAMDSFKEWLFALDPTKVVTLMDFSISKNYLVKGKRIIEAIKKVVPERNIEDLDIPFRCVATDLYTGEEVVFSKGPLFEAVRASISIPSMFRPVKWKGRTLVDGGMVNTLPLDRVPRTEGDILVGINVNAVDTEGIHSYLAEASRLGDESEAIRERAKHLIGETFASDASLHDKILALREQGREILRDTLETRRAEKEVISRSRENKIPVDAGSNYYTILERAFNIMNHTIAEMSLQMHKPDLLAELPFDTYTTIPDYGRAREISDLGRAMMAAALDRFEGK